ncbi:MAG: AAA family ATPase, partial [Deltaproteobacteria bacterium]
MLIFRKFNNTIVDMVFLKRILDLPSLLEKKSFFLFGPRATGKSFLIERQLSRVAQVFDLLSSDMTLRFSARPSELESLIEPEKKWIVIDEVQKVPELLDEVHRLIEKKWLHFLLT